jgi:hypothetical protein
MEALCFSRNPWKNQSNWEEAQDQIHGLLASIKWQQFLMSDDLQSYQQDLATQRSEPISQRLLFAAVALLPVWARPRLRISRTGNWSASPIAKPSEPLIPWQTQPYRFLEFGDQFFHSGQITGICHELCHHLSVLVWHRISASPNDSFLQSFQQVFL